jgi:hypothetical protein
MVYFIAVRNSLNPEPSTSLTVAFKGSIELPLFEHRKSIGNSVGMLRPAIIHFTTREFVASCSFPGARASSTWSAYFLSCRCEQISCSPSIILINLVAQTPVPFEAAGALPLT